MSDSQELVAQEQTEDEAMAAMLAGYNARAATAPADTPAPVVDADPESVEQPPAEPPQSDTEPAPEPEDLKTTVENLKAEVKAIAKEGDPDVVRKLYGEIGNINRQLKQMQQKPEPAAPAVATVPVVDEMAAAIKAAEDAAEGFPELAGPLVAALKAVSARQAQSGAQPSMSAEEISALAQRSAQEASQRAAQEALVEEHPDFETVYSTPEFKTWLASKPADYQKRLETTWSPLVVARGLTEFKESLQTTQQTRQKKQDRLRQGVVPQGAPAPAAPSTLTDEELILAGYNKGNPRPVHKR